MSLRPPAAALDRRRMWTGVARWLTYRVKRARRMRRHRGLPIFGISKHLRRDIGNRESSDMSAN